MKIRLNAIGFVSCVVKELEMKFITSSMNVMTVQCNSRDKGDF